jgi:murein L,D-transpeptidase YcbB/YkuD
MPYNFRQEPGRGNALGAIKFMFQNEFSIYLHDTPQQWAFKRAVRAVSHGCVRIEKPMDFARYLLKGTPDWDVPRLQQAIFSGAHSKPVFLKQRPPVFIDYYTAWVDSAGVLQFRDDIYQKDAPIVRIFKRLTHRSRE